MNPTSLYRGLLDPVDFLQKTTQIFDTAVQWIFIPNVQLDVSANFGLTRATPAVQVYTGLSQRF
jgi:hypothetical protein